MPNEQVRCAIYTRKSSEEGLEQSFNSLDAQREACEAFIASQKHEGWVALDTRYDDGGFSGGSMDRPALKQLLEDIATGKISTVVVYKIDRLTRSLLDFSKIVEAFDRKQVSFVSVTQQFNTTTSMGRLTLNILLSFAQFEREVTGERIRDKFAASKKKGMWMGGNVPLGYRIENRQLVVVSEEAELVREIYKRYLDLRSVTALRSHLQSTKRHGKAGRQFSRGSLYHLLSSRIYVGQITHRGQVYEGQHHPIIDKTTWERVAEMLRTNNAAPRTRPRASVSSLLTGMLFDAAGVRYTPTHAVKEGKRYRYYTSQSVIQHQEPAGIGRLPAGELEKLVLEKVKALLSSPEQISRVVDLSDGKHSRALLGQKAKAWSKASAADCGQLVRLLVERVIVASDSIEIEVPPLALRALVLGDDPVDKGQSHPLLRLTCAIQVRNHGNETRILYEGHGRGKITPSLSLVKGIVRARRWYEKIARGEVASFEELAKQEAVTARYVRRVFQCALLCPMVVEGVVNGRVGDLLPGRMVAGIPASWAEQRKLLGQKQKY